RRIQRELDGLTRCYLRLGRYPCHEFVLADTRLGGQLRELLRPSTRAFGGEMDVLVRAERLDEVRRHLEGQRTDPGIRVDQRSVLDMLGPDAHDHVRR